jgi:hypothetical protein
MLHPGHRRRRNRPDQRRQRRSGRELEECDPREFFYDPRSKKHDFRDARYMGVAKWMDSGEAADTWPDHEDELNDAVTGAGDSGWSLDDREIRWTNTTEKSVRVVDHWYIKRGQWYYCIYSGDIVLEQGLSPFLDEKGASSCKYLMFSNGIDHDNDRYGFFRDLKSPQDEINHRRSKALHALNTRRLILTEGAVEDVEKTRREVAKPDGVVVLNPAHEGSRFEIDSPAQDVTGNVELLAEAKAEIENFGPNPALIGQGSRTSPAARSRCCSKPESLNWAVYPGLSRLENARVSRDLERAATVLDGGTLDPGHGFRRLGAVRATQWLGTRRERLSGCDQSNRVARCRYHPG